MTIKTLYLDNHIGETLLKNNRERNKAHKSSGKLSASMLGNPLQWQILKTIGVPQKEVDEYVVRKFLRGNHVEDWLVEVTPNVVDTQKFVEYKDVVGYADILVNMDSWGIDKVKGVVPHEVKSITNASFRWIKKDGYKHGHALQGALYALALESEWFVIDYVASDDYRVESFLIKTDEYKKEIDDTIDAYNKALKEGVLPEFKPKEKWQESLKYNNYPEFVGGDIESILKNKYSNAYKKLKEKGGVDNG